MFAEKPSFNTPTPSKLHLPPIDQNLRRKNESPSTTSYSSMGTDTLPIPDDMSELKTKYTDYTTWLKTSTRHSRGPVLTQELLKTSLCRMGIDLVKAEQLVSTCSWYVYQFQKDLKISSEQQDQSSTIKCKKQNQHKNKSKKTSTRKCNDEDSTTTTTTTTSLNKDEFLPSDPIPSLGNNNLVLPAIHVTDLSTSSRFRHVDFNYEEPENLIANSSPSHWRSALVKTRVLSKLQPLSRKSSTNGSPIDLNLSPSQRNLPQHGLNPGHTRSILRKQTSVSSSTTSTEISNRKMFSQIMNPSSTGVDEIPLGTRSKLLFGGSDCFAQIMNELEQQNEKI